MKTLIFDIDGTITDMWPLERRVLATMIGDTSQLDVLYARRGSDLYRLYASCTRQYIAKTQFRDAYRTVFIQLRDANLLPEMHPYRAVSFIKNCTDQYRFVYVTGGLAVEADYVLTLLGLSDFFDRANSISRDTYLFAKITGRPFKKVRASCSGPLLVIADGQSDALGAEKAGVPCLTLLPDQQLSERMVTQKLISV